MQNTVISCRITSLYESQPSSVVLCIQNSDFMTKITVSMCTRPHLWTCTCKTSWLALEKLVSMGPRPHLWIFALQNRDIKTTIKTTITSLYGSQTSPVDLWIQNSVPCLPLELLVSMCHSPLLWFCAFKTATLALQLQGSMCPCPHLLFCKRKIAWLAPKLQLSIVPRPHLCICACKTMSLAPE